MVIRDNSQGSNHGGFGAQPTNAKPIVNKFINPQKLPLQTNFVHRMSGGAPIES